MNEALPPELALPVAAFLWIAYVILVAVQSRREEADYMLATSEPVTFEEVVTERPRINQLEAAAILDRCRHRNRAPGIYRLWCMDCEADLGPVANSESGGSHDA